MRFKKTLALFLTAQVLLASGVACTNDTTDETQAPETDPPATDAVETEATSSVYDRVNIPDDLPEMTFNGQDFRFYVNEGEYFQLVSEDTSGVGLDSVIYERNRRVEDRFDVKISASYTLGAEAQDIINTYVSCGEHIAECVDHWHRMGLTLPTYQGALNWLDLPHLNWEQPWWNQQSIYNSTFNGKLWTVTGDLAVTAMLDTWAIAFNMNLLEDYTEYTTEQLYNLVLDGEWTLDKFIELGSSVYVDVDGQGKDPDDIFGYAACVSNRTMPWVTSLGENFFTKTGDMAVECTLGTERIYKAVEKLVNFHWNVEGTYSFKAPDGATDTAEETANAEKQALDAFTNGNVVLYPTTFNPCFQEFRNLSFDYGMLPFPKYDAEQERYLTVPEYDFSVYSVPASLPFEDYDMVGIVMEALMAESWKTVSVAYYDEALKGAYSKDETTAQIIDMIMDGRVFDWGYQVAQHIAGPKVPYLFCYAIQNNDIDIASQLAAGHESTPQTIINVLGLYEDWDE